MPITYRINKELRLLYTVFSGRIDDAEAFRYLNTLFADTEIDHVEISLVVLKGSILKFNVEDVEDFARELLKFKKFKSRKRIAIIIDSPIDTVAATIFSQTVLTSTRTIDIELFYTLDAALNYLNLIENYAKVVEIIRHHVNTLK